MCNGNGSGTSRKLYTLKIVLFLCCFFYSVISNRDGQLISALWSALKWSGRHAEVQSEYPNWGGKVFFLSNSMTLNVAPLLAPDRVTISGTAGLPGLCHPSPEFKEKGFRKKEIIQWAVLPLPNVPCWCQRSEARIKKKNLKETTCKHWSVLLFCISGSGWVEVV